MWYGRYGCDLRGKHSTCPGGGASSKGVFHCKPCSYDVCPSCFLLEAGLKEVPKKKDAEKVEKKEEKEDDGEYVNHKHLKITFVSGD